MRHNLAIPHRFPPPPAWTHHTASVAMLRHHDPRYRQIQRPTRGQYRGKYQNRRGTCRWINRLLHRYKIIIHRRHGDIGTFQSGCCRQHNIGMFGQRVPTPFMCDNRVRLLPRRQKAIQILMMVERVSTGPVNQLDIRKFISPTIIIETSSPGSATYQQSLPPG